MSEKLTMATREAYAKALVMLGEENPDIVVFDADLSAATKTSAFQKKFPDRHFNAGIAEMNMAGMAAGMSTCGKIPFVSTFAMFGCGRIYDMIRNAICYPKLNVKFALTHAGLTVGADGATHQALEDIALMNELPNMTVFVPCDAQETMQVIRKASQIDGPVYIRLGRAKTPGIYDESYTFTPGKTDVLSEGDDVTVIACGIMVDRALKAQEELKKNNIHVTVLNASTIKPFDSETLIKYAQRTKAVVSCEEHSIYGGLGSVVAMTLSQNCPVPLEILGVKDKFGESGDPEELLQKHNLTTDEIVRLCKKAMERK